MRKLIDTLQHLDRRIIFIFVALSVIIPLLKPLGLKVMVTPLSQACYDALDKLKPGDVVLMSFDYDPASAPELQPMANAVIKHLFEKKIRIIAMGLWPQGPQQAIQAFDEIATAEEDVLTANIKPGMKTAQDILDAKGEVLVARKTALTEAIIEKLKADGIGKVSVAKELYTYGVDYLNLGYLTGALSVVQKMGISIPETFPVDMIEKKPTKDFKIMEGVKNYHDIGAVFSLTSGSAGVTTYISVANAQYGTICTGGCTAVSALEFYPYVQSKQLTGLLEGLKGASEYEKLVNMPPDKAIATKGMEPQAVCHMVIILFILLANFTYFMQKYLDKQGV
jgi:hypothetical protein